VFNFVLINKVASTKALCTIQTTLKENPINTNGLIAMYKISLETPKKKLREFGEKRKCVLK